MSLDAAARLERELHALGQHMRARPKSMDLQLDRSAYYILLLLDYNGPGTLKEIAAMLELEQSTVNRQVNKAIELGLLRAGTNTTGPKLIHPTEQGTIAFERDRHVKLRGISSVLDEVDPPTREALIAGLAALNTALAVTSGAPTAV